MIRVAGTWEFGWNTPIKEMELWQFVMQDFAVDHFCMSPRSGIQGASVMECDSMVDAINDARQAGAVVVFVDEIGTTTLREFTHPENVLYVFGKANFSPLVAYAQPGDQSVRIETTANIGGFWPHQAASIVLYDRMVKAWQSP